ncbi:MAG: ArsR family transcriptional regulator [Desulfurococcales archaeon]|nr:ArsR family transcriptional regulator [Desulfurococcales archaeon]MEB3758944.1 ArsR family transcriptional regulator [Desulfurococcales archaeon]MEB3798855.1 ArsR family transcriptional regulator [Desulfurococcales archaeon]
MSDDQTKTRIPEKEGIYEKDGVLYVRGFNYIERVADALSGETRIMILKKLGDGEMDVAELAEVLQHSKANISSQIRKLEEAGLVKSAYKPGKRGIKKIVQRTIKEIRIFLE